MTAEEFTERIRQVRQLGYDLMAKHNLPGWTFAFNRRKSYMGLCLYHIRTIEVSVYLVLNNPDEEVVDTILHEIAHALVGPEHGHDAIWKRKCLDIGARPIRCGDADMPLGRWRASCGQCGKSFHRHRKPAKLRGWFCRGCGPDKGNLVWQEGV
jgi:predicted SprT family Zn-dependent metalloprotease